jgi:hypothetical protein
MIKKNHHQYPTKSSAKDIWIQHVWINTSTKSGCNHGLLVIDFCFCFW